MQLPAVAFVADLERVLQRHQKLMVHALFGFGRGEAADVDAADRHPVGDLVLLGIVVGVGDRAQPEDEGCGDDPDFGLTSQLVDSSSALRCTRPQSVGRACSGAGRRFPAIPDAVIRVS